MHRHARIFGAFAFIVVAVGAPAATRRAGESSCVKPPETDLDRTLEAIGATPEEIRELNAKSEGVRYVPVPVRVAVTDRQAILDAEQRGYVLGFTEGEDAVCRKMKRDASFCETAE